MKKKQLSLIEQITDLLVDECESSLNDNGVDPKMCLQVATAIVKLIPVPRVLIQVSGGCVETVYADAPITYKVKDWDNIKEGDAKVYLASDFEKPDEMISPELLDEVSHSDVEHYIEEG